MLCLCEMYIMNVFFNSVPENVGIKQRVKNPFIMCTACNKFTDTIHSLTTLLSVLKWPLILDFLLVFIETVKPETMGVVEKCLRTIDNIYSFRLRTAIKKCVQVPVMNQVYHEIYCTYYYRYTWNLNNIRQLLLL